MPACPTTTSGKPDRERPALRSGTHRMGKLLGYGLMEVRLRRRAKVQVRSGVEIARDNQD